MEPFTIKDVARICGVGVSTVSRAINNHPDINPQTRQRILEVIEQNGYIPNNSARNLKRTESKTIAVLIRGITNPFFQGMIKTIEQITERRRYGFLLQQVDEENDEVEAALELEKEKKPCGIVFLGGTASHKEDMVRQLKAPFVVCTITLGPDVRKELYSSVAIDDVLAGYEMTSYLISMGHRRIAMVAARKDDAAIGRMRLEGYCKALADHHIPVDPDLILYAEKGEDAYSMVNGYRAASRFIQSGREATAFLVISDNAAFGVCKAIRDAGKSVPGDYSVASFDGIEMASYYNPTLTTMKQPCEEMAAEAMNILLDRIDGFGQNEHRLFQARLTEGESVAGPGAGRAI